MLAVALVVIALGAALALASVVRTRRAARAVDAVAARLVPPEGEAAAAPSRTLGTALERLDRACIEVERRRAEDELVARRLEAALDHLPQAVVIADESDRIVYRNRRSLVGVARNRQGDALIGDAVQEMLRAARAGATERRTLDLFGPPRRVVVVSAERLVSDDGELAGEAIAVLDDITERARLEAVRRDFVANISHELKTPVGAVALLAETMLDEDDPGVRQRLAERIVHEAHRVGRTIEDLLELSRIEAEQTPQREVVPVPELLADAVERVRPAAHLRSVTVEVPETSARVSVVGDRRQLVSALGNLLDNAIKYSDEGSSVTVRVATDGRSVDLAVVDRGIGIPRADLERIFERFYRVDRARSRETGGTGLGLAIVRHVATNHDGDVRVESVEGEGSTFTLRLPAGPGPVPVTPPGDDHGIVSSVEAG